eukprot:TRINITY_DN22706_c0_g1_i1.p1 TRINITY_DN22706_c0_g1~~TRINITY_DN22706_c0_g1_i1.p1  ORF type:complete len:233 (+),score=26.52 TRINITY_DN22706_c0_g1_i1:91-789(+)
MLEQHLHLRDMKLAAASTRGDLECTVFADSFDFAMQGVLFFMAFTVLVISWRLEKPRRSVLVFTFDASKQGAGFGVCHLCNMFFSILFKTPNISQCVWYFVNITLDCTVRVWIAYRLLLLVKKQIVSRNGRIVGTEYDFGYYGHPPQLSHWKVQIYIWITIVTTSRLIMAVIIRLFITPIGAIGGILLAPLESYSQTHGHQLELVVVMVVLPFLLNITQLLVQDSFLKHSEE